MQVSLSQEFTISRRCDFTYKKLNILYLKGKLKIGKNKYLNDFFWSLFLYFVKMIVLDSYTEVQKYRY